MVFNQILRSPSWIRLTRAKIKSRKLKVQQTSKPRTRQMNILKISDCTSQFRQIKIIPKLRALALKIMNTPPSAEEKLEKKVS